MAGFIEKRNKQMAKKTVFQGIFVLTLALELVVMGCEYNYLEKGGTLTIVNKTSENYYVGRWEAGSFTLLTPGSSVSWDFAEDTSVSICYYSGESSDKKDSSTRIEYGVKKTVNLVY
jgi:hypothetical protein